jgi:proteic killer suppression protein
MPTDNLQITFNGLAMILSFRSKALKAFWQNSDASGLKPEWVPRVAIILDALDVAAKPEDLNLPGMGFHALKGNMKGRFADTVSRNWRITYAFANGDASLVDLEDYHG